MSTGTVRPGSGAELKVADEETTKVLVASATEEGDAPLFVEKRDNEEEGLALPVDKRNVVDVSPCPVNAELANAMLEPSVKEGEGTAGTDDGDFAELASSDRDAPDVNTPTREPVTLKEDIRPGPTRGKGERQGHYDVQGIVWPVLPARYNRRFERS
ncbi:hypothetical protein NUW54_g10853 [Trametes sanguinea]|uniref:Uncharacterized protein n=1 Tax=Trametes sanguinea TaxID=158606 RepID=A0ACC1NR72_9APHY|nr:hypothetical protein NUW54_g10853 [Trametes sanguinea]